MQLPHDRGTGAHRNRLDSCFVEHTTHILPFKSLYFFLRPYLPGLVFPTLYAHRFWSCSHIDLGNLLPRLSYVLTWKSQRAEPESCVSIASCSLWWRNAALWKEVPQRLLLNDMVSHHLCYRSRSLPLDGFLSSGSHCLWKELQALHTRVLSWPDLHIFPPSYITTLFCQHFILVRFGI